MKLPLTPHRLVLTTCILTLVAGCANTPVGGPLPGPAEQAPATGNGAASAAGQQATPRVVKDLGFAGGPTINVNLYSPVDELGGAKYVLATTGDEPCWALTDIYQYDVSLAVVGSNEVLTSFSVTCKGHAQASLQHLKPGVKYEIRIVARGNKGGTAPDVVLNAKTPAIGTFDLTHVDPLQAGQEIAAAIQVELDCGGQGYYERTGRIDIIPKVKAGGQVTYEPESGSGSCYACGDYPILAGTTTYDSTFHGGTNGDVFNMNPYHNHWTNEISGWGWVQRDFPAPYPVSVIDVARAFNDQTKGTCTEIYVKLRQPDGNWLPVDTKLNQNLTNYHLVLDPPVPATAFRLELKSAEGWLSADGIMIKADTGIPCPTDTPRPTPTATPVPTAPPSVGVTPPPATPTPAPTPTPLQTLPPCEPPTPMPTPVPTATPATPAPTATPTKTPTPAPTATPTPAPTATPTPAPTPAPTATPTPRAKYKFTCYTAGRWGSDKATYLKSNWSRMTGGSCSLGSRYKVYFNDDSACSYFHNSRGTPSKFTGNSWNPRTSSAGVFAANCMALKLNCLRSDNGLNPDGRSARLRDVKFVGGECDGKSIGEFLDMCERKIGDDDDTLPTWCTPTRMNDLCEQVNNYFDDEAGTECDGRSFRRDDE